MLQGQTKVEEAANTFFELKGGVSGLNDDSTTYYAAVELTEDDFRAVLTLANMHDAHVPGFRSPAVRHMEKPGRQYSALLKRKARARGGRPSKDETALTDELVKQIKKTIKKWVSKHSCSDRSLCRLESDLLHTVQEYCRGHRKSVDPCTNPPNMGTNKAAKALQDMLDISTIPPPTIGQVHEALRNWWDSTRDPGKSTRHNIAHSHLFNAPLDSFVAKPIGQDKVGGSMTLALYKKDGNNAKAMLEFKGVTLPAMETVRTILGMKDIVFQKLVITTHKTYHTPDDNGSEYFDILAPDSDKKRLLRDLFTALPPNAQVSPDLMKKKHGVKMDTLIARYNATAKSGEVSAFVREDAQKLLAGIRLAVNDENTTVMLAFDDKKKQQVHFYRGKKKSTLSFQLADHGTIGDMSMQVEQAENPNDVRKYRNTVSTVFFDDFESARQRDAKERAEGAAAIDALLN